MEHKDVLTNDIYWLRTKMVLTARVAELERENAALRGMVDAAVVLWTPESLGANLSSRQMVSELEGVGV